jgi:hypothetical protein
MVRRNNCNTITAAHLPQHIFHSRMIEAQLALEPVTRYAIIWRLHIAPPQ